MYGRGRPVVDQFDRNEQLFRRFRKEHLINGMVAAAALHFPKTEEQSGQSVNRSRFGRPQDALWHEEDDTRYEGWGVFQFPVSCLPAELICSDTKRCYTFFPKHRPLPKNYAHSEVWCDRLPRSNSHYEKPTSLVRKELRAIISQNVTVVCPATV